MFYRPAEGHGLPHDPFKAIVAPRPIGWISTRDAEGRPNLAPYSFFNAVASAPPVVMFSSESRKDSLRNIEATGEFVCNFASFDLREAMNASSAPLAPGASEFERAGLEMAECEVVGAPRVARAAAALECRLLKVVPLTDLDGSPTSATVAFGQVVGVHIDDRFVRDGRFDLAAAHPIARCGYMDYASVDSLFAMVRPKA
ncbi:flavin reductase family protein [Propylenella binzhouense]|uniref:Flavin reductase family protein n=1 Tax=Propylenella binzhouense TaxID=2555902 RepID=A0A964T3N1_9HYPH|nr:flavin reductase family protein [Propylenella binzhouense]MYZ47848.1 flavin reductase family protein [Propylenella binzhouense]